jgi:hypothetical protein
MRAILLQLRCTRRKLGTDMSANSAAAAGRWDRLRRRSAELHEQASALVAIARRIVHDVRNSRLEARLLRRIRKP